MIGPYQARTERFATEWEGVRMIGTSFSVTSDTGYNVRFALTGTLPAPVLADQVRYRYGRAVREIARLALTIAKQRAKRA